MKTTLFLPVRNEINGVKLILPRIDRNWVDEVVVVDGNSTDGTYEYFQNYDCKLVRQKSIGVCGAYWECLEVATGDVIIAFSPDNNSIPELIPPLIKKMKEGYDMVIVSRYKDGAKSEDDDPVTSLGNWMFTKIINILFGSSYTDTLVMFRAFRKGIVFTLGMDEKIHPVFEVQMAIKCAKHKLKMVEIPGDEPKRIGGVRKMRPIYNGSAICYVILKELFRRR
jgi:glycosyltransferase involved in cell wall biosynthesis